MANAASELHDLYADWRERAENASSSHSLARILRVTEKQGAEEFKRAFRLITELDDLLTRFELEQRNVAVYRKHLEGWARVPLMLASGWTAAVSEANSVVPEVVLDQLQGFDSYLEGKVLTFDDWRMPSFRALIEQANSALSEDDALSPQLAGYLRRLLAEIQVALDDEQRSKSFDFADAVQRLWVTLMAASAATSPEKQGRWRRIADQIMVGILTNGSLELAKAGIRLAITGEPGA